MDTQITINPLRILEVLLSNFKIIFIVGVVGFLITLPLTRSQYNDTYEAFATVYAVANNTEGAANPDIIMRSANVIKGYSQIATSIKVLDRAASLLNREGITGHDIKNIITVEYDSDSPVLTISARSDKPNLSISIANAVAESFVLEIRAITAQKNAAILDVSSEAEMVTDGKRLKWLSRLAGFLAGVFAMICFFAVRDIFSTRIYSSADASLDGQLEIIGTVPILGAEKHKAISDE